MTAAQPRGMPYEPALAALARGDAEEAEKLTRNLIDRSGDDAEAWRLAGLAATLRNDPRTAVERFAKAITLDPRAPRAWCDLGSIYLRTGQLAEAEQSFRRALSLDARGAAAWNGLGATQDLAGDHRSAAGSFMRALALVPEDAPTALNLASAQLASGDDAAAGQTARGAVARHPDMGATHFVLGNVLAAQGRHDAAIAAFRVAVARDPHHAEAHFNLALALDEVGAWRDAARACEAALALSPGMWPALAQLVFLKRRLCEWHGLDALSTRLRAAVRNESPGITPFSFLAEPATAAEQLQCARTWARMKLAESEPLRRRVAPAPARQRSAGDSIRVGFVSSGFNNHPTALLTVELMERLRACPLTTVGFATTASDGGALRGRIAAAFHEFQEVHGLAFEEIASRIESAQIDVLIDLRGYGGGAVTEVLAMRPAAIQVNWLAYPGTSGATFIDYLIADPHVVPPAQRVHYSEAIASLPHSFQPCDTTRAVGAAPSRAECGLPPQGVVFASFNNSYKISPETFACWMRVLHEVPQSVLWLLAGKDETASADNLRRHARDAAIDPDRLVFMRKLPHDQYLARFSHVDLFLDTWPYNAHTTASDALWAGCPVLTLPGETFASRVAASLLRNLELPELVAADTDDYVARAVALAREPEAFRALRNKLESRRRVAPLFDMARFSRDFATAITTMVDRRNRGERPADFSVSP